MTVQNQKSVTSCRRTAHTQHSRYLKFTSVVGKCHFEGTIYKHAKIELRFRIFFSKLLFDVKNTIITDLTKLIPQLSQNTLGSLGQLVQLIQAGDYANGIGLHTQMVSGPDFAQIASFMPGIKVLLQSAMQLQVYLR